MMRWSSLSGATETLVAPPTAHRSAGRLIRSPFSLLVGDNVDDRRGLDALVECARQGSADAFRTVTERMGPMLMRYVRGYLNGDLDTADDVVQDTFVAAWNNLDHINDGNHLRPWLFRVARNKAITWLRRRGPGRRPMASIDGVRARRGFEIADAAQPDPAEPDDADWVPEFALAALRRALDDLPDNYAPVVRLHYLRGHSSREVADLLDLPHTTVKMRLHRARNFLRHRMLAHAEALCREESNALIEKLSQGRQTE